MRTTRLKLPRGKRRPQAIMNSQNTKGTGNWRDRTPQLLTLFLLISCAFCVPFVAQQQLPLEPSRDTGASVTGAFEGWFKNNDGSFSLLVGYFNRNQKQTLDIRSARITTLIPEDPTRDSQLTSFRGV